jgi:hypothetical protein
MESSLKCKDCKITVKFKESVIRPLLPPFSGGVQEDWYTCPVCGKTGKSIEFNQDSLYWRIKNDVDLTDSEKESLFNLVSSGCRSKNKERLNRRIFNLSVSLWKNYGIFERVMFENGRVWYCAGQSYPDEIRTLRELILD